MGTLVLTKVGLTGTLTISVDDTNVTGSGYWPDGDAWITTAGTVNATAHTPATTGVGLTLRNGVMLNPRGNITYHGLDGRQVVNGAVTNAPFTANAGTDVCTAVGHQLSNGQALTVRNVGGGLPAGLAAATIYWVVNVTTDTFKLSATKGGSAIDITTTGTGTHYAELCLVYPVPLVANDVLIIGKSAPGGQQQPREAYLPGNAGSSNLDECMTLHVLAANPTLYFKPNTVGDPAARQMPLLTAVQPLLLPQVFTPRSTSPSFALLEPIFLRDPCELANGWTRHLHAPNFQNPGYGAVWAALLSLGECKVLETGWTLAQRQTLMNRLVQWAIHVWGAYRDGRVGYVEGGGHCQGMKSLVIFGGVALGDSAMADPDTTLGSAQRFKDDGQYFTDGKDNYHGSPWKWCFQNTGTPFDPRSYQSLNPRTWVVGAFHDDPLFAERYRSYLTSGPMIGAMLAMLALRKQTEYGKAAIGWMTWFMERLPTQALQDVMAAPGNPANAVPTGYDDQAQSWSPFGPPTRHYCEELWWAHRFTAACLFPRWVDAPGYSNSLPQTLYTPDALSPPHLVCHDAPAWGGTIALEVLNAPTGVIATELRFGNRRVTPVSEGGATIWVASVTPSAIAMTAPNLYGYTRLSQAIPANPGMTSELQLCVQVVFTLTNGQKQATNALVAFIQP